MHDYVMTAEAGIRDFLDGWAGFLVVEGRMVPAFLSFFLFLVSVLVFSTA